MIKLGFLPPDVCRKLSVIINRLAHHPSSHRQARESITVPGTPAALRHLLFIADLVHPFQIDQHQVRIVSNLDAALSNDVPHARRRIAHPVNHLFQRAATVAYLIQHQRQRILHRRQTRWRGRVRPPLFFERVGRVIGGHNFQSAVGERLPQPSIVFARFERRVHLHECAESRVIVNTKKKVVDASFAGDEIAMIAEQFGFGARRDVQHMESVVMAKCQIDRSPRCDDRCLMIADPRVISDIVRASELGRIRSHRSFIFTMGRDRERRFSENSLQCGLLVDEQITCARTNEYFDSRRAVGSFQFVDIVDGRPDIEPIVHQRLRCGQRQLFFQAGLRRGRRHGVRHLQKRRDATFGAGSAGRRQVLFVRQAWLAKVDLVVDYARQEVEPHRIDRLINSQLPGGVDFGDFCSFQYDRNRVNAVGQHNAGVFYKLSHSPSVANPLASIAGAYVLISGRLRNSRSPLERACRFRVLPHLIAMPIEGSIVPQVTVSLISSLGLTMLRPRISPTNNRLMRGTGRVCTTSRFVRSRLRIGVFLLLPSILGGCRTPIYTTRSLPIEFQAPLVSPRPCVELEAGSPDDGAKSRIRPGDLVAITILTERTRSGSQPITAKVASDGSILLPEVGNVEIGGLEPEFAQERIATALITHRISSQPSVKIVVTMQAAYHISVAGAVARPGTIELPSGSSDLVAALQAVGGLSENAGTKVEVQHRRGVSLAADAPPLRATNDVDSKVQLASLTENSLSQAKNSPDKVTIDLSETISSGIEDRSLSDGDTITVLPAEKRTFRIEGLAAAPADVELKTAKDTHILDAIELAGGKVSRLADLVFIIRQLPKMEEPIIIEISLAHAKRDEDKNLRVAPGDIVLVRRTMRSLVGGMFHVSRSP